MWKWSAPYSVRLEENKIPVMLWSLFFSTIKVHIPDFIYEVVYDL